MAWSMKVAERQTFLCKLEVMHICFTEVTPEKMYNVHRVISVHILLCLIQSTRKDILLKVGMETKVYITCLLPLASQIRHDLITVE